MTYLKCKNCGHYNELRSEFLTFCGHCGRKLPNNYADWKTKRPESDFEEFQRVIAVPYNVDPPGRLTAMWQGYLAWAGKRGMIMSLVLIIAVAAVAGGYFGKQVVVDMIFPKMKKSSLYIPWETVNIGRQALQISTPMHLGVSDKPLAPALTSLVEYAKSYHSRSNDGMQVEVNMYSYRPDIDNNLDMAASASVSAMQQTGEISDLHYTANQVEENGLSGMLQQGDFSYKNAVKLAFRNLLMVEGQHRWEVTIRYRADDVYAAEAAQRILKSIRIQ